LKEDRLQKRDSNKKLERKFYNQHIYAGYPIMKMGNLQPFSNLSLFKSIPIIREAPAILAPSAACVVKPGSEV